MKFLILAVLVTTTSAFAQLDCRADNTCKTPLITGAGTMLAGYASAKGFLAEEDLRDLKSEVFFKKGQGRIESSLRKVQKHDQVTIEYMVGKQESQKRLVDEIQKQLSKKSSMVVQGEIHDTTAARLDNPKIEYSARAQAVMKLESDLNKANSGQYIKQYRDVRVLKSVESEKDVLLAAEDLIRSGNHVVAMKRLSLGNLSKISKLAKNGYVMGAVAIGLGLVTLEQYQSSKIHLNLNKELEDLKKQRDLATR